LEEGGRVSCNNKFDLVRNGVYSYSDMVVIVLQHSKLMGVD